MRTPMIKAMTASLLAGSLALSTSAHAVEGLYSADELLDADVYDSSGKEIGEVEDILLGDDMAIHSLVIKTGDVLGLGGRDVVAERGSFTVRLEADDDGIKRFDDLDYQIHMEADSNAVKNLPEYDESWWNQTRSGLRQAWENTKKTSESAWENTKEATSSTWQNFKDGARDMKERTTE
ncbi:PRC-barrel domain-containing protein [Marinobacter goseongensis]|uniref:PRC-barrel domain-containing protein n=1 Tax=Marinobacter goseongensis TaxID=453838 RepID=UPI002006B094|nr:PRC-barrel domain-containing protein [Marinobacter goseongensis]MCK7550748.1 PRC-barrel domain-containing protein [Marinobacter goseongensis]